MSLAAGSEIRTANILPLSGNMELIASYEGESSGIFHLDSISIEGVTEVPNGGGHLMTCVAHYPNEQTQIVPPVWSDNSSYATITSRGQLRVGEPTSPQSVVVTAITGGKADTHTVAITGVAHPTISSITIEGPDTVSEGYSQQYLCRANLVGGGSTYVTPIWRLLGNKDSMQWNARIEGAASVSVDGMVSTEIQWNQVDDIYCYLYAMYEGFCDVHSILVENTHPATLEHITITGPSSVYRGSDTQYEGTAYWADFTTTSITLNPNAAWSENSSEASVSTSGVLSVVAGGSQPNVVITLIYGGKADTHFVNIKDVPVLSSLTISGPGTVNEQTTAQYTCVANYSDGTSATVSPTWSESSPDATITATGLLTAGTVLSDQNVTITAAFGGKIDTHAITIKYVP